MTPPFPPLVDIVSAPPEVSPTAVLPGVEQTFDSACPLDCPDACSLEVRVVDGRVTKVGAGRRNPLTRGFICSKVSRFGEHLDAPERLLYPAVRRGPKGGDPRFEQISWEAAFDLLTTKIVEVKERFGGEAILPLCYGGSNGKLTQDTTDARLFRRLGAARLARTVCAAPSRRATQGLYGRMPGVALPDFVHSRLIVLWGVNPAASGIHLVPILQEAQKNGAKLVVIDPRRTQLAKRADLHLAPRPGSDLALGLAALRWLFTHGAADRAFLAEWTVGAEELERRAAPWTPERAAAATGLDPAAIEDFARLYAETSPAVIRTGWGMERNRNGGSAIAAAIALPAVAGKFGVRGGGYTMSNSGAYPVDVTAAAAEPEPATRVVNMNLVGRELTAAEATVRLLFVYNCNPLMTLPNQELVRRGLLRDDLFTVVSEQVMTDTALLADLVLPATTFLEHDDLVAGYGALLLQRTRPVVPARGEARSNVEVFAELCGRLGLARPGDPQGEDELIGALFGGSERIRAELARDGVALPDCGTSPVQFVDNFPRTRDRKVYLVADDLDREAPGGLYTFHPDPTGDPAGDPTDDPANGRFPLALLSPATNRTVSTTLGELYRRLAELEMHPADAAARGLEDGATVRVWNDFGEVRCPLRLSADLLPGVVLLPKGLWSHHTLSGTTANALAPDSLTDLGGGACFNDARVEVERAS
jgi:anaerobic selenocysteine-containing dehydrogenase